MIYIDSMSLTLPQGFEQRAENISRLVGEQLGNADIRNTARIESISIPNIQVARDDSDDIIAGSIASSILKSSEFKQEVY